MKIHDEPCCWVQEGLEEISQKVFAKAQALFLLKCKKAERKATPSFAANDTLYLICTACCQLSCSVFSGPYFCEKATVAKVIA